MNPDPLVFEISDFNERDLKTATQEYRARAYTNGKAAADKREAVAASALGMVLVYAILVAGALSLAGTVTRPRSFAWWVLSGMVAAFGVWAAHLNEPYLRFRESLAAYRELRDEQARIAHVLQEIRAESDRASRSGHSP